MARLLVLCCIILLCSCGTLKNKCCPTDINDNPGTMSNSALNSNERAQCDVYIDQENTTVKDNGNYYLLELPVKFKNDDDPKNVEIIITLPVESPASSIRSVLFKNGSKQILPCKECGSVIKCRSSKTQIAKADRIEVTAKISKSRFKNVTNAFGVFAYTHNPADPQPNNNYFFWSESSSSN